MKKKLIAIAVATASVMSGVVNAESGWQTAGTGGRIDIGGTITVENIYDDLWQWKLGDAINLSNTSSEMTNDNKTLTVTMDTRKTLLVGKSEAFKTAAKGMGASPSISFTDADNNKVQLVTPDTSSNGEAVLTLPIKGQDQSTIGSLTLNVKALGVYYSAAASNPGYSAPRKMVAPDAGNIFHGGLPSKHTGQNSVNTANVIAADGGWSVADMKSKYDTYTQTSNPYAAMAGTAGSSGDKFAAVYSYSMSVDSGQQLVAEFTSPVTTTTQWSAPLNIAITYN
ncbi:hypothetical protein QMW88_12055 [Cronobacter dublinensis]|uniref:F4 family fimbrial subunit n=1 Tax=Cronobacter dublinensis TaxID=413497 RepID=UPI0024C34C0F|nr:hypothetical protein [Cronobacter dublinensis]MDK1191350.1 hypothetical protein [Cronobacter dublinensis]MDK1201989.1 hypothetical protein [Cronobacter dublinensis]HDI3023710.1 hypothetical protein [Cronobacter turicensis]HDI3035293.1 hypothetical protein [Cronobacter turicensis]